MKVLLTVHQFLPDFIGGTEILTFDVARELQRRGCTATVFTGFPAPPGSPAVRRVDHYRYQGIQVHRFHHAHVPMGEQENIVEMEYDNRFAAGLFRDRLRRERPDVVHFFHLHRLSAALIDACHDLGVPAVMTPTDFWLVCPRQQLRLPDHSSCRGVEAMGVNCLRHLAALTQRPAIARLVAGAPDAVLRSCLRGVRRGWLPAGRSGDHAAALSRRMEFLAPRMNRLGRVLAPTRFMLDVLCRHGLDPARGRHSPYGIDLSGLRPVRRQRQEGPVRVGYIGTLAEHKGPHLLLAALAQLPADLPVAVYIYGDPETYPDYARELRRQGAREPRVRFRGTFPNTRIGEVLSGIDVLAVPSLWYENTPLVVYSAQASGCPVIASEVAGLAEAVQHRRNGLLFPAGSSRELAGALRLLATDPDLLAQLSAGARPPRSIEDYVDEALVTYRDLKAGGGVP